MESSKLKLSAYEYMKIFNNLEIFGNIFFLFALHKVKFSLWYIYITVS